MFGRFLILLAVGAVVWAVMARTSSGAGHEQVYVVRPADTLWSIAVARYAGDPRDAIYRIERRNGLADATLVPGEQLVLP
jgi:LysM repeat protein